MMMRAVLGKQTDPRSGRRYRKVRNDFIARCKALRLGCWLYPLGQCVLDGAPIDYDTPGRHPSSPELHHMRSVATHPWLVYEPSNFAVGHARCNQVLGKKPAGQRVMHKRAYTHTDRRINGWTPATW